MPAACCGVVGLKTALGAVPTEGVYPLAASFDTVGPMARTVADCALAHAVLTATEVPAPALAGPARRRADRLPGPRRRPRRRPQRDERALAHVERLRALGAEVARALAAGARERHVGRLLRRDRRRARGDLPEPARRVRAAHPGQARPRHHGDRRAGATRAAARSQAWRARAAREPDVDLVLAPTLGYDDLPPAGVDELGVRLPFSAYARAFSYLGWPAIAIGAAAARRPRRRRSSSAPRSPWSARAGCVSVEPCARPASPT